MSGKITQLWMRIRCSRLVQAFFPGYRAERRGKKLIRAKQWKMAERHYSEALLRHPKSIILKERFAIIKRELGKGEEAIQIFSGLFQLFPHVPRYAFGLARALHECGRVAEAIRLLEEEVKRNPRSIRLLDGLSNIYFEIGDWNNAKRYREKCLSLEPPTNSTLIFYFLGCMANNDMEGIQNCKCNKNIKDNFLKFSWFNKSLRKELYEGIPHFSDAYFQELIRGYGMCFANKSISVVDEDSTYRHVCAGKRKTIGSPDSSSKKVHVFGASHIIGVYHEDAHTIPSFLQYEFNAKHFEAIEVVNHGASGVGCPNHFLKILGLDLKSNDSVVLAPAISNETLLSGMFHADLDYYSAIHSYCLEKKASFLVVLLPSLLRIANPSERESFLQSIEMPNGNTGIINSKACEYAKGLCRLLGNIGIPFITLDDIVQRPHNMGEVFFDRTHFNHKVNKRIAESIYLTLSQNQKKTAASPPARDWTPIKEEAIGYLKRQVCRQYSHDQDIAKWLSAVKYTPFAGLARIGAIVMNCNPFTLGHRYLVETAASAVDGLYLFVVEDDKSFFPFTDRFDLVKKGIADLSHKIRVVPSGKFIISSFSFPGYFTKETATLPADATADVAIFGAIIAPNLDIKHRFVGEEPACLTTNGYNETLYFLLPEMGVKMHTIPRKQYEGLPISASAVRQFLKAKNFDAIKQLVPETTFQYLLSTLLPPNHSQNFH